MPYRCALQARQACPIARQPVGQIFAAHTALSRTISSRAIHCVLPYPVLNLIVNLKQVVDRRPPAYRPQLEYRTSLALIVAVTKGYTRRYTKNSCSDNF